MDDPGYAKLQYRRSGRSELKLPAISPGLRQNFCSGCARLLAPSRADDTVGGLER